MRRFLLVLLVLPVLLVAAQPARAGPTEKHPVKHAVATLRIATELREDPTVLSGALTNLARERVAKRGALIALPADPAAPLWSEIFDDPSRFVELGRAAGVTRIVLGGIDRFADRLAIHLAVVDVTAGAVLSRHWATAADTTELQKALRDLLAAAGYPADAPSGAKAALGPCLENLRSPDAGVRFAGAVELGKLKDARAVAPLVELLKNDGDTFVRRAAGRSLGEIGDGAAVPALFDAVLDREHFVAMTAARALTAITGRDLGFRDGQSRAERERLVAEAREWWRKR